ncbi:hypothetical protein ACFO5K_25730 [Nocardia halotolerans]|uniref:ESAT-6-like protein n=1 Tax=Nocardia halotolerans TaxID=1755878 RepID=A0ABV8VQB1_9NOCA
MSVKKVLPGADDSSDQILNKARAIEADLIDFKADFDGFFNTQDGDMSGAAIARQAEWSALSNEITAILQQATQMAKECHTDFRALDRKLAADIGG